ncbi:MAG: LolA family protein [Planctomycetota bacterium]|jgi:outer membrane lipoprotein-sorting protein
MKPLKQTEDRLRHTKPDIETPAAMDSRILMDSYAAMGSGHPAAAPSGHYKLRRILMKNTLKYTAAAVILIAATLSLTLFDKTVASAWAIEDTIEALENITSIKIIGSASTLRLDELGGKLEGDFAMWAKRDLKWPRSKELRFEMSNCVIVVDPTETTFFYDPNQNRVIVKDFNNFHLQPWLDSNFFQALKRFSENWKVSYGNDEETNRESIFVTCTYRSEGKSWWFQFDAQTKFPVRFKQWKNMSFEGNPEFYAENIEYNLALSDEIFEFEIPEGTEVVKLHQKLPDYLDDPDCGIATEGLSDGESCSLIVEDYLRALIDGDWEYLTQVRPIFDAEGWEQRYKKSSNWATEVIQINPPALQEGCKIGPVVTTRVKYSNGQVRTLNYIVKIQSMDGIKTYVIAGTYNSDPEFSR